MKNKITVKIENFRELLEVAQRKNPNHIVYKYKKNINTKEPEYVEKKYIEFKNDIKYVSSLFLNLNLRGKKIAVIGNNRYEWCVSYLAITTGDMIVVPLDKALPENEIKSLIKRSEVEVVIFEKKHADIMKKILEENNTDLKILICMDDIKDKKIINFSEILEQGKKLVENGYNEYDNIKIDSNKMSIILFTSGTTNEPKGVMLSQKNICSNIVSLTKYVYIYSTDTLLSFLPIHHTFECTITFLYGLYAGATVAFCDGLRYISQNLKEYKITVFVAVPLVLETMYKKIQKSIKESGKEETIKSVTKMSNKLLKAHIDLRRIFFKQILDNFGGHLRVVLYGAASMNKTTIIGYNNLGIKLTQGYGLTETSPVISAEAEKRKKPGSAGLVLENLECKIANKDKDGIGEIAIKGPNVMLRILQK